MFSLFGIHLWCSVEPAEGTRCRCSPAQAGETPRCGTTSSFSKCSALPDGARQRDVAMGVGAVVVLMGVEYCRQMDIWLGRELFLP